MCDDGGGGEVLLECVMMMMMVRVMVRIVRVVFETLGKWGSSTGW